MPLAYSNFTIYKGGGFYDRIPAGRDTKNLISGILAIVFDGFGSFFSVGFVFTRTTPIFGLFGVWTTPSAQAAAIINLAVVAADGADLKPQRQKIGVVLVKIKPTRKKSAKSIKNCGQNATYKIFCASACAVV